MYSPKISEMLIPVLYKEAKKRGVPMTTLVNRIIAKEVEKLQKGDKNDGNIDAQRGQLCDEGQAGFDSNA